MLCERRYFDWWSLTDRQLDDLPHFNLKPVQKDDVAFASGLENIKRI
jgi:hypothetical protein